MFSRFLKLNSLLFLFAAFMVTSCEKDDPITGDTIDDNLEVISRDDPDSPHRPGCFSIVYPVNIVYPDGTLAEATDAAALRGLMQEWRAANPNATERPSFEFPISVEVDDETIVEVQSTEELRALRDDCDHPIGPNWYRGRRCYNLVFPVSIAFPDGTTASVDGRLELRQLLADWRTNNPDAEERPMLVFPVTVEFSDGETQQVDDVQELRDLRDDCDHPSGPFWHRHRWCIELVYPITVELPNGNTVEANNARQLRRALRLWRYNFPNAEQHPNIVYPIQAELPNGNIVDVNGPAALRALLEACDRPCGPFDHPSFRCYDLVFPVTIVFPGDSTAIATDAQNLRDIIIDWRVENPDVAERPGFQFPIEVELPNGNVISVANAEMLHQLRRACRRPCFPRLGNCFRFQYPITVELPNGNQLEAANGLQLRAIYRTWRQNNPDSTERPNLVYPFQVELQEDESIITVETPEQFHMLIESCHP